jgi:hypothetical protein
MSTKRSSWRDAVYELIHKAEDESTRPRLTFSGLARAVGVSRVTLWRDISVKERIEQYIEARNGTKSSSKPRRRMANEKSVALSQKISSLEEENGRLLKMFVYACRRLVEKGIDPATIFGTWGNQKTVASDDPTTSPWRDQ